MTNAPGVPFVIARKGRHLVHVGSVVVAILVGCGAHSVEVASAGASGGSSTASSSSSSGAWSTLCPPAPPALGTPCAPASLSALGESLECEYGYVSSSIGCDAVYQCSNSAWQTIPAGDLGTCAPGASPRPTSCPGDYGSVPQGSACTPGGLSCTYDEAHVCACIDANPEVPDAGLSWQCTMNEPGCPIERPRIGSPCDGTAVTCTYSNPCGPQEMCVGGVWILGAQGC